MKRGSLALLCILIWLTSVNAVERVVYGENSRLERVNEPVQFFKGKPDASLSGREFMISIDTMEFWKREDMIVEAILSGNMPSELKQFQKIVFTTPIVDSVEILRKPHKVEMLVLPDYLSVGSDDDFVRMPMGPLAAQQIADSLNCILPTTYLVDRIAEVSEGHIDIFPFRPLGGRNMQPIVFQDSDNAIKALYKAKGYEFGQFISGLKKEVVITYKIQSRNEMNKYEAIYGWFHPDGRIQQPLFIRHGNFYVDYSHGIRLINRTVVVDGKKLDAKAILESPTLYRLLSDEPEPLKKASYAGNPKW
ncbi:MAG: hypothetical protein E7080_04555 [Bacteroidales bacterium]|nr:hypothetical protein [Bacteroidales bacterium]